MTAKKVVVVVGDLLLDVQLYLDKPVQLEEESFVVKEVYVAPGGVAGNVSVALSRLGVHSRVVSAVGRDVLGTYMLSKLEEEGVNTRYVRFLNSPTGITVALVRYGGQRTLLSYRGASGELLVDYETALSALKDSVHLFISGYILHGSHGVETLENLLKAARVLAVEVSIDIGGVPGLDLLASTPGARGVDYVFLNESELRALTGLPGVVEGLSLLESVLKPKAIFLKRGEKGSMVKAGGELLHVSAFKVKPVDTTGCGDAFNAGVIYALIHGHGYKEALELGNLMGAYKATGKGAQHLPRNLEELLNFKAEIVKAN